MVSKLSEKEDPLVKLGISPELAQAIRDAGYYTLESIAIEAPHILLERVGQRRGFDLKKAQELVRLARNKLKVQIMTAKELFEEEKQKETISTGCKALDELLDGGVRTGELLEVAGPYGVGKTEFLHTLCVNAVNNNGFTCLYFDTEGAFSARRLVEIAEARGFDSKEILDNVLFSKVYGSGHLIFLLENAHKVIKENDVRLILVDSLTAPFRAEYPGREFLAERQQKINRCLRALINYMRAYDLAAVITNQVLSTPVAYAYEARPETVNPPTGGHVLAHAPTHRLYFRSVGATRIATLIDSNYLPWGEATFKISKAGVVDAEEKESES